MTAYVSIIWELNNMHNIKSGNMKTGRRGKIVNKTITHNSSNDVNISNYISCYIYLCSSQEFDERLTHNNDNDYL